MKVDAAAVVLLTDAIRLECCRADQIAGDVPAIPFGQAAQILERSSKGRLSIEQGTVVLDYTRTRKAQS